LGSNSVYFAFLPIFLDFLVRIEQVQATQFDAELHKSSVLWVINSDVSAAFIGPGLDGTAGRTFPHRQGILYDPSVLRTREF
jgi:hypothetical protein